MREHPHEHTYELEVLPGLERFAEGELRGVRGVRLQDGRLQDGLRFSYGGDVGRLKRLRCAVAVYALAFFDVPRPRALLGHQQLTHLLDFVASVAAQDRFESFRVSAAGRESAVFARLTEEIERASGLRYDEEEGELLLRFVPEGEGWAVLARLTPRPLSARGWRVCNMAGGLNATLAQAMLRLGGVRESDRVFNPMCGSATLLIERSLLGPTARLVGADLSDAALDCAEQNIRASKRGDIELARLNVVEGGLPPRAFDLIVADLPWGDAVGTHDENARLYPAFLRAMLGTASKGARLVVLTHEVKLFERVLAEQDRWTARQALRVYHGGHHPRLYLLTR